MEELDIIYLLSVFLVVYLIVGYYVLFVCNKKGIDKIPNELHPVK